MCSDFCSIPNPYLINENLFLQLCWREVQVQCQPCCIVKKSAVSRLMGEKTLGLQRRIIKKKTRTKIPEDIIGILTDDSWKQDFKPIDVLSYFKGMFLIIFMFIIVQIIWKYDNSVIFSFVLDCNFLYLIILGLFFMLQSFFYGRNLQSWRSWTHECMNNQLCNFFKSMSFKIL